MAIDVIEKLESRTLVTGVNPSAELRYAIRGTSDEHEARAALLDTAPSLYDPWGGGIIFLAQTRQTVEPIGPELWEGTVIYGYLTATGDSTFTFDTSGGRMKMQQSWETMAAYNIDGAFPPDNSMAINTTATEVNGVEIAMPVYTFSETHYKPDVLVTPGYKGVLHYVTGTVNKEPFRNFAAGEALFLGVQGVKRGSYNDWELSFRFGAIPNRTDLYVGNIGPIVKDGWDYLWVRYRAQVVGVALLQRPVAVYIERVYRRTPFAALEI